MRAGNGRTAGLPSERDGAAGFRRLLTVTLVSMPCLHALHSQSSVACRLGCQSNRAMIATWHFVASSPHISLWTGLSREEEFDTTQACWVRACSPRSPCLHAAASLYLSVVCCHSACLSPAPILLYGAPLHGCRSLASDLLQVLRLSHGPFSAVGWSESPVEAAPSLDT